MQPPSSDWRPDECNTCVIFAHCFCCFSFFHALKWTRTSCHLFVFFLWSDNICLLCAQNWVPLEDNKARPNQDHIIKTAKQKIEEQNKIIVALQLCPRAQRPTCILKGLALLHNNNHLRAREYPMKDQLWWTEELCRPINLHWQHGFIDVSCGFSWTAMILFPYEVYTNVCYFLCWPSFFVYLYLRVPSLFKLPVFLLSPPPWVFQPPLVYVRHRVPFYLCLFAVFPSMPHSQPFFFWFLFSGSSLLCLGFWISFFGCVCLFGLFTLFWPSPVSLSCKPLCFLAFHKYWRADAALPVVAAQQNPRSECFWRTFPQFVPF